LAFPCNQFGGQEPGTNDEILDFVEQKFAAKDKFTWFDKGHVNGKDTREVYSFLKNALPAEDGTLDIRWNFAKFLVDHEGKPYKRYSPQTNPEDMITDIEAMLQKLESSKK
jgi:glutathione peroxidase